MHMIKQAWAEKLGARKRWYLAVGGLTLILALAATFTLRNLPAHASGTGGGGCVSTTGSPVCTTQGNTAFAEFESFTDCVGTEAFVSVFDQVAHNPPTAPNSSLDLFVEVSQFDFCAGQPLKEFFGETSNATFTVDGTLSSATVVASVPVTDFNSGTTGTITINLAFQGFGPLSQQIGSNHFRSAGFLFDSHFNGDSRAARATGTFSDGTTNFAASSTLFASLSSQKSGTVFITH